MNRNILYLGALLIFVAAGAWGFFSFRQHTSEMEHVLASKDKEKAALLEKSKQMKSVIGRIRSDMKKDQDTIDALNKEISSLNSSLKKSEDAIRGADIAIGQMISAVEKKQDASRTGAISGTGGIGILYGKITLYSGNCVPKSECDHSGCLDDPQPKQDCKITGVKRNVYIRRFSSGSLAQMDGDYLKNATGSTLVKKISSDSDGNYSTQIPRGRYSIFVADRRKEYCTELDTRNRPCEVRIMASKEKEFNISINHASW